MNPIQLKVKFSGLVTFNFQSGERGAWVIFGKLSVEPGLEFPAHRVRETPPSLQTVKATHLPFSNMTFELPKKIKGKGTPISHPFSFSLYFFFPFFFFFFF